MESYQQDRPIPRPGSCPGSSLLKSTGGMAAKKYLISGRVQGVGFRYFVARLARELHLAGWVRNLPDGRVEAYARGPAAKLKRLEAELRIGPPLAEVRSVEVEDAAADAKIEGFLIR